MITFKEFLDESKEPSPIQKAETAMLTGDYETAKNI